MQEILFSKPMILPCVKTTSMYSLYSFYKARIILSRVRISWLMGFSRAYSRDLRFDCSCYTCDFRALFSFYFCSHWAISQSCYCRICFSQALADYSYRPFPSVLEISASSSSFLSASTFTLPLRSVFSTSSACARSDSAAISMFNFLMNSVFSSRYFLISVFDRSYLSIIFFDFSSFSFNSSAIFYKLSLSSSNFFFRVSISFSFCCSFVLSTASFFYDSDSWFLRLSTSGFVELLSRLRISRRAFFYSCRLVTNWFFSPISFSKRRHLYCRFLVYLVSSSVCCLRVERIYLQFSSLALSAFSYTSYFLFAYRISLVFSGGSPPPMLLALSLISSLVIWILLNLAIASFIKLFISSRSSPRVNSSSSYSLPLLLSFLASCSRTKASTLSLLSMAISAISSMCFDISPRVFLYSSTSFTLRKLTSTVFFFAPSSSSAVLVMASFNRLNIQK